MQRTLTIETPKHMGKEVRLCGWINSRRDHGKIIFIDLRDRTGQVQVVFDEKDLELYEKAKDLRPEWVIEIVGKVGERPKGMENSQIKTGKIEIQAQGLLIFSKARTLPFPIETDGYEISEEKRLKYRYLDIRRKRILNNLEVRQKTIRFMREFMQERGFLEVETPILTKSTPEGARDYLVPSRLEAGKFYALPQSPQQYKQLLMVAGVEKYFQIVRCFRDEDPRADRQPEFTQLDVEMSFIEQEDILNLMEEIFTELVKEIFPEKRISKKPFPRLIYKEAMEKYNSDKPDLRENKKDPQELAFCFILNFPMFEWKKEEKRWDATHHPFTMPQTDNISKIKKEPENILAFQYDLALNGSEIAGGSIRTHKPEILQAVFEVMGHKKEEIKKKFGHLLEAFEYGVPPHGGFASGFERFLQMTLGEPNIREVIAFPKTGDSKDPMMSSPSLVDKEQLKELHLKITK